MFTPVQIILSLPFYVSKIKNNIKTTELNTGSLSQPEEKEDSIRQRGRGDHNCFPVAMSSFSQHAPGGFYFVYIPVVPVTELIEDVC